MSNVIPFTPRKSADDVALEQLPDLVANFRTALGARGGTKNDTFELAAKIKTAAEELIAACNNLERDGCQIGCDAIGYSLRDLDKLRQSWLLPDGADGFVRLVDGEECPF